MNLPPDKFKRLIVAATLALLPLLYFYPVLTERVQLMPGDGWTQNLGIRVLTGRLIAQGILPLWNPYIFAGMPLLASIQPGVLYPPNWLFAVFSPGVAMNVLVITTYHLALIGSYLYARRAGMTRLGALITAIIFSFGGYMIAHAGQTNQLAAAAWLPWVLLAIESLYQRAQWRWVALGALFVALQLFAGHPQMTFYTALLGGAYALFCLTLREERERRWRFAAFIAAMAVCGLLLSAIQLLPEVEMMRQGERAQISYEFFCEYSLPPRQTLALIFPYFFGGAFRLPFQVTYWGEWIMAVTCGYAGMLGLLLGLVAVFGAWRKPEGKGERRKAKGERQNDASILSPFAFPLSPLIRFWAGAAAVSLLLAFGSYLPFEINRVFYHLPVYNLFRASSRHLFEFDFTLAALAGLGLSYIARTERTEARRVLTRSIAVLAVVVVFTAIIYRFFGRFFGQYVATQTLPPAGANSLTNPDALVPITFCILSVAALWFYAERRTILAGAALAVVLLFDLASFGHFFAWRTMVFDVQARLADPPSVQFIKAREPDLQSFRILSQALWPYPYENQMSNYPNICIVRGLQSVNGYDPMRLPRMAAVGGQLTSGSSIEDITAFGASHQGLNLLNVKYLLRERRRRVENGQAIITFDGIGFSEQPLNLRLAPGTHCSMMQDGAAATELAFISTMANSTHLPDGTPVVGIKLYTKDGRVIERELQAGRDTSEWAYDRADVRSAIKHSRAHVAESWPAEGFEAHRYLGRVAFERAEIERIELNYLRPDASLELMRASLYDAVTKASMPLDDLQLPSERWRKLATFEQVDVYENLKLMPRAWFVRRVEARSSAEVLRAVKEGRLSDNAAFDPAETALLETEDFGGRAITLPPIGDNQDAQVKVTRYEPQRIELETHNSQPGFLMLSEIYYRGWDAWIDGQKTPVSRTDYALRGVAVPPGEHRVEFLFRAPTFRNGAVCSGLGAMILLAGAVVSRRRARQQERFTV